MRPGDASDILCGLGQVISLCELALRFIKWPEYCCHCAVPCRVAVKAHELKSQGVFVLSPVCQMGT